MNEALKSRVDQITKELKEGLTLVISSKAEIDTKEITTQDKIDILFDNFREFLKEKNRRYGDSALHPMNIFSKASTEDQICNRLDDKLSRIMNGNTLKKNDLSDIMGYISLLLIKKGWLEFNDLLD
jgi:hypothetical protein